MGMDVKGSEVGIRPLLLGLEGPVLTPRERALIEQAPPMGFILFARNIQNVAQTQALCAELAEYSPFKTPLIAVDQEGGRVQRVQFGGKLPPAQAFGAWYKRDAAAALEGVRLNGYLLAAQLREVGATWLLGPLVDVAHPATHRIIGDRSFADDAAAVMALAEAYRAGVWAAGCRSCLKHAPGHGRAVVDSHVELPVVDVDTEALQADMQPFAALAPTEDFVMTAHIRYPALDRALPATYSATILDMMRRDWRFEGLILADDMGMNALEGDYAGRIRRSLAAGCDVAITALSVLHHGMAGTVFDEENFRALERAVLPELNARARAYLQELQPKPMPGAAEIGAARARLAELWADGAGNLGDALSL